jgi:hypothetical protein
VGEPSPSPRTARQLAEELVTTLEALANIYYLKEKCVDPLRLSELKTTENRVFGELVQCVLRALSEPGETRHL